MDQSNNGFTSTAFLSEWKIFNQENRLKNKYILIKVIKNFLAFFIYKLKEMCIGPIYKRFY